MPYPSRISPDTILAKARQMVEAEGIDRLSLNALAAGLGVKTPSLYRYFSSKTDLLRALNLQTVSQMIDAMQAVTLDESSTMNQVLAMAQAWRSYAHANPAAYTLAFTHPELSPDAQLLEALVIPVQRVMALVSGEEYSLAALRGLWALLHGFILLELSGQFRRGGDLEAAFVQAVESYLAGWSQGEISPSRAVGSTSA